MQANIIGETIITSQCGCTHVDVEMYASANFFSKF